jgi:PAS domain S-box-containing protein
VAERNLEIARQFHRQYLDGKLTEAQSRERIRDVLLGQTIGKTGYIYCLDSQGIVAVHPNPGVEGRNLIHFEFISHQINRKTGYIEYDWQNPGEEGARSKALYMTYFAPYDWIISVTTYRDEFMELLPMEEIRRSVKALKFGTTGYIFVTDRRGNLIIHPEVEGSNFYDLPIEDRSFFEEMLTGESGQVSYWWQNPGENVPRKKIALYGHIPELQWIVCASGYFDEIYAPIQQTRNTVLLFIFFAALLSTVLTLFVSSYLTRRLQNLVEVIEKGEQGDLTVRAKTGADDEIGHLGRAFNTFLKRLQSSHVKLADEVDEHRATASALKESEALFKAVFNQTLQFIGILTPDGTVRSINQSALDFAGVPEAAVSGKKLWELPPYEHSEAIRANLKAAVSDASRGEFKRMELEHLNADGETRFVDFSLKPVTDDNGKVVMLIPEGRDITDQKKMEAQLLQSQKMDAIGTLAGGIAHDFNNSLQAISGYTQLLLLGGHDAKREKEMLATIQHTCTHASELTKQLLTFSRKVESQLVPLDLNVELSGVVKLLKHTLPRMIDIETRPGEGLWIVEADRVQFEQIVMNLGINAGHAMPDGGLLVLETQNVELDDKFCRDHLGAVPGTYVMIAARDTGNGMDAETRDHIFEPFFTTRETGKGTGLGLAMVYGIVKSHKGYIDCSSAPGQGTTFRVYLPAVKAAGEKQAPADDPVQIQKGRESILLVDDDPAVRQVARAILERFGYRVHEAGDGESGLERHRERKADIDLVILDLNMPGMGGQRCLEAIKKENPNLPVLIASGLAPSGEAKRILDALAQGFVGKPYLLEDLLQVVRDTLDRSSSAGSPTP